MHQNVPYAPADGEHEISAHFKALNTLCMRLYEPLAEIALRTYPNIMCPNATIRRTGKQ